MVKNRDLSNEEKLMIDNKVEKFLNDEVFSWDIISEDEGVEEKIIKEIIYLLKCRISDF